jgi:hypothetical protein
LLFTEWAYSAEKNQFKPYSFGCLQHCVQKLTWIMNEIFPLQHVFTLLNKNFFFNYLESFHNKMMINFSFRISKIHYVCDEMFKKKKKKRKRQNEIFFEEEKKKCSFSWPSSMCFEKLQQRLKKFFNFSSEKRKRRNNSSF